MSWLQHLQDVHNSMGAIADHERTAAGAAAADMDARDACAVLCGRRHRFYVHQSAVLLGRASKSKGEVDVDLALEEPGTRVSRLQCLLEMHLSYGFVLRNVGRQVVHVNNVAVPCGSKAKVPHLSVVEVGGVQLLVLLNLNAAQRACLQQPPVSKEPGPL